MASSTAKRDPADLPDSTADSAPRPIAAPAASTTDAPDAIPTDKRPRILLGLAEIAGYYANLEKGFRDLGVDCVLVDLTGNPFDYGSLTDDNWLIRIAKNAHARRLRWRRTQRIRRGLWTLLAGCTRVLLLFWAIWRFDVFIFGYKSTFLRLRDLPLLKLLGKKLIFMFHGSDSRPPYLDGGLLNLDDVTTAEIHRRTIEQKRTIRIIDRYADYVIDVPPQALFHECACVNGLMIGVPFRAPAPATPQPGEEHEGDRDDAETAALTILHSPSYPAVKGSVIIDRMIGDLIERGHRIDFVKITGVPNATVLELLQRCDLVVDQLWADTPLSGLATEAAFFGKPSVLGGYYAECIREYMPEEYIPPSVYCAPEEVESAIERLLEDRELRCSLGRRAAEFVKTRWTPARIARRYLEIIAGRCPEEFFYHPRDIRYLWGGTASKDVIRKRVRELVDAHGSGALCLDDKPEVRDRLLAEAGQKG